MHTEEFKLKRKFIVRIGKMLHQFGTPAYRLESHLMSLANALNLRSSFIISPTSMTFVIWTEGHEDEYTHAARVEPGDLNLGSLSRTDDVIEAVIDGELTLLEAELKLNEIETMPNPYGRFATGFSYGIASGAFALLMRGSIYEVALSSCIGLVVYIFVLWSERSKGIRNMLEPLVAMIAALIAYGVAASYNPAIGVKLVTLSSIIVFIPGLALTIGLNELSSRHLVSGTAKVMDALMMLFKLYFGAYLGMELGKYIFGGYQTLPSDHLPPWVMWISILMLSTSLIIAFRTRKKHIVWSLAIAFLSFGVSSIATTSFGIAVGAFIGAFVVGVYSNLFTRLANSPAVIVAMQGLIVLVPGSKTFISLNTYVGGGEGFVLGEYAGQQALVIFMSIVAGLIFANSALPPKKSL